MNGDTNGFDSSVVRPKLECWVVLRSGNCDHRCGDRIATIIKGSAAEAANLRFLIKLVLDALEHEGLAKVNRDKDGFPTGIVLSIKASPGKLTLEGQPPEVIESSSK